MEQQTFLESGSYNALRVKTHHHRADPPASVEAATAMVTSGRLNEQESQVADMIAWCGRGTAKQMAKALMPGDEAGQRELFHIIDRRVKAVRNALKVRWARDERGEYVKVDGCHVLEAM
jgi:hypothetical protein